MVEWISDCLEMSSEELEDFKSGPHVLYELLVYKEWKVDLEKHRNVSKYDLLERKDEGSWWWVPWPEEDLAKAASLLLPWSISVSPNGKLVAILEDSVLEIRQSKDEYNSIVGRAAVPKDKKPQFRKLSWSPDSNMVAVSSSDSSVRIYDCFGSLVFKIPLIPPEKPVKKLIVGLEFIKSRDKKGEWELLIVYSCGLLECYGISSIDKCVLNHQTTLSESGISCTLFSQQFGILFAAVKPLNFLNFESSKFLASITAWRLLNEQPYYKRVYPTDDELSILELHGKMRKLFTLLCSSDCICKIVMSPSNVYLATLHARGVVLIWHSPSLRFHSTLDKLDSKKQKVLVPLSETRVSSHAVDIEWRKDNKLIVAWKNGTVSIHDVNSSVVLTYFGPEFLHGLPRLASASSLHGFLALECEVLNLPMSSLSPTAPSESELNESRLKPEDSCSDDEKSLVESTAEMFYSTLYLITDIEKYEPKRKAMKFVQRTFRLLGVKMTTPEELFERYLKSEDFEKAFEICEEYGLDVMKVYMRQWRTSEVNEFSIHQYLANVGDQDWILTECLDRVPESLAGARHLLEFGLKYTDIKPILDSEQQDLTEEQEGFIKARLKLLDYAAKLKIYERIVDENSYDMRQYDRFRKQSLVRSAVDFARSADTHAIVLLMTEHGVQVLPYWLNILDNYPESLNPNTYSRILPECDGDGNPVQWTCSSSEDDKDWAQLEYSDKLPLSSEDDDNFSERYTFDSETLTKWYKKRAQELEKYSTVVENATDLLKLGVKRNIKGLEDLLFDFEVLSSLVYDLNISMTFSSFQKKTISKKLQLFVQSEDNFCEVMLKWIHPFLEHFAAKNSLEWTVLYNNFMVENSKKIFGSMIDYFRHILNGNLSLVGTSDALVDVLLECVYSYDFLDKLDETESLVKETIKWIKSSTEEVKKTGSKQKLVKLLNEIKVARILIKYCYERAISFIHGVKSDVKGSMKFVSDFSAFRLKSFEGGVQEWEDFLSDLVETQRSCFLTLPKEHCYKVCVSYLLKSGVSEHIEHSPKYLCCTRSAKREHLSFETSVRIVIEASQYYFNSSSSCDDRLMELAKTCLLLIKEDNDSIQRELDLIFAIRLLSEMGVTLLPLQVRQTEDKTKLVDMCFDKNPRAYSNPHKIYKLASKLHLTDRNSITLRLAQESLRRKDFWRSSEFCDNLILNQYSEGWKICMSLSEETDFKNVDAKIKLITFSAIHSPARILPQIMKIRTTLQKEQLVSKMLNNLMTFNFGEKLDDLLKSETTEEMLPIFYNLWDSKRIQNHLGETSSNNFLMVHPSLYATLHLESCKIVPMIYGLSSKETFIEVMNCFLKLMITSDGEFNPKVYSEVLSTCAIATASEDTALSLSYLLNLIDSYEVLKFFKVFEESYALFQFVFYYLCLKNCSSADDFSLTPFEALKLFLEKHEDQQCKLIFKKLVGRYKNFKEASQVTLLESGIDLRRFKHDEDYKSDTIFGLAMSEQYENLKMAVDLAQKNNIPVHEVIISHVRSLLLNNLVEPLAERGSDKDLLSVLTKNQEDSLKKMVKILPSLNGTNYQQLISFFSFIKSIKDDYIIWELIPKEHISLLKKVRSISKDIDYKSLVSCKSDLSQTLAPLMREENINIISKLIRSLPSNIKSKYNFGQFFCRWAVKSFFDKCLKVTFKQCVQGFESLAPFFQKLTDEELRHFVKSTILSERAMREMDSGVRKHLVLLLSEWCQNAGLRDAYSSTLTYLQNSLDLLNRIWDEEREEFSQNLKSNIFLVEESLKQPNENPTQLFNSIIADVSLTPDELLYLYKILKIEQPLMNLINDLPDKSAAEHWRRKFCSNDKGFSFHEMLLGKTTFENENQIIPFYMDALKNYFSNDLQNEEFELDFLERPAVENFFTKLLDHAKIFEQLVIVHRFVVDLPRRFSLDRKGIEQTILRTLTKVNAGEQTELKYSLAGDIIEQTIVDLCDYEEFLIQLDASRSPSDRIFLSWICLNSEDEEIIKKVQNTLQNEDESICTFFISLPKLALDRILPRIIGTKLYPRFITLLVQEGHEEVLRNCIESLREANLIPESRSLYFLISHTPKGLRSFHTALNS